MVKLLFPDSTTKTTVSTSKFKKKASFDSHYSAYGTSTECFIMNQFSIMYFLILAAAPAEPVRHQSDRPPLPLRPGSSTARHCLRRGSASEWGKVFLDTGWMEGEEFSKIYFCLNPIHLLGTRQGKLFPWHRVCLRGRVGPSGALSLLPMLLRINGSTWSPNPPLHPVRFPSLSFPYIPVFLCPISSLPLLPFPVSPPSPTNGNCWPVGTMLFPLCETNSSPRRGLLNPRHSLSLVLLFCKMC